MEIAMWCCCNASAVTCCCILCPNATSSKNTIIFCSFMRMGQNRTCVWNEGHVSLNCRWQLKDRQKIPFQCFILHFLVYLEQSRELFVGMPLAGTPAPLKRKKPTKLIGKLTHEGKICKTAHVRIVWISIWISAVKISHSTWLKS